MSYTKPIQLLENYDSVRDWTGHGAFKSMFATVVLKIDQVTGRNVWVLAHQSTEYAVAYDFAQAMAGIYGANRVALVAPESSFRKRDFGKWQHKTKG